MFCFAYWPVKMEGGQEGRFENKPIVVGLLIKMF